MSIESKASSTVSTTRSLDGGVEGAEPVDGREGVAELPGQDELAGPVEQPDDDVAVDGGSPLRAASHQFQRSRLVVSPR